jgi:hypothetical protein
VQQKFWSGTYILIVVLVDVEEEVDMLREENPAHSRQAKKQDITHIRSKQQNARDIANLCFGAVIRQPVTVTTNCDMTPQLPDPLSKYANSGCLAP